MLYKYCKFNDHSLDNLSKNNFIISSADSFNDYYDLEICFDLSKATKALKDDKNLQNTVVSFKEKYKYDYMSQEELLRSFLEYVFSYFIMCIKAKTFVGCLTEDPTNSVMWSHYADDSKGFVVGYNENDLEQLLGGPLPTVLLDVIYDKKPFDATDIMVSAIKETTDKGEFNYQIACGYFEREILTGKYNKLFLLRKSKEWKYEKEKRFLKYYGSAQGNEHKVIGNIKPAKLIIGQKMGPDIQLQFYAFCLEHNINLFKEKISWDISHYDILIEPFTNQDARDLTVLILDYLNSNELLKEKLK